MAYKFLEDPVMADALAGVLATRLSTEQLNQWDGGTPGERKFWDYRYLDFDTNGSCLFVVSLKQ